MSDPSANDILHARYLREAAAIAMEWAVQWNQESGPRTAEEIAHKLRRIADMFAKTDG